MIDINAIRKRLALAAPGPWFPVLDDCIGGWAVAKIDAPTSQHDNRESCQEVANFAQKADAEFIAHARRDVPALVAEVLQLRRQVEELEWELMGDDL